MNQFLLFELWNGSYCGSRAVLQKCVAIVNAESEEVTAQDVLKSMGVPPPGTEYKVIPVPHVNPSIEMLESE